MSRMKPMMKQYYRFKEEYKESILMFRLGTFYEIFNEDAYIVHKVLGLKISARNVGFNEYIPMCGIPISYVDKHEDSLVKEGYSVAVCEQVPGESDIAGVVNRKVTRSKIVDTNKYIDLDKEEYERYIESFKKDVSNKGNVTGDRISVSIIRELKNTKIDEITPQQALTLLYKWKGKVSSV